MVTEGALSESRNSIRTSVESRILDLKPTGMLNNLAVVLMELGSKDCNPKHQLLMDREILIQKLHLGQAVRNLQEPVESLIFSGQDEFFILIQLFWLQTSVAPAARISAAKCCLLLRHDLKIVEPDNIDGLQKIKRKRVTV